jgi:DNA-binding NarL/FixJ family response regulator
MKHILLLEDDADTRVWFSELLIRAFGEVKIVPTQSLQEAEAAVDRHPFCLAMVDIYLPDGRGIDFIAKAKPLNPGMFCVVVTAFDDSADIFAALEAGADGYLLKSQDKDRLVRSLKEIMEGAPPLSPSIARRVIKHFGANGSSTEIHKPALLTQREAEVLTLIAQGMTRNETAQVLGIRPGTVAGYIKRVYEKLNISSRAQAALEAKRMGLI